LRRARCDLTRQVRFRSKAADGKCDTHGFQLGSIFRRVPFTRLGSSCGILNPRSTDIVINLK
jgi:hypothetical protein